MKRRGRECVLMLCIRLIDGTASLGHGCVVHVLLHVRRFLVRNLLVHCRGGLVARLRSIHARRGGRFRHGSNQLLLMHRGWLPIPFLGRWYGIVLPLGRIIPLEIVWGAIVSIRSNTVKLEPDASGAWPGVGCGSITLDLPSSAAFASPHNWMRIPC
jgi:hypothetical protein